jgi:hypothetical protein
MTPLRIHDVRDERVLALDLRDLIDFLALGADMDGTN